MSTIRFSDVAIPGFMISQAWLQSRTVEGATLEAIRQVIEKHPFFQALQTVDVPYPAERREVAKLTRGAGRPHTMALTRILAEAKGNLSSLDPERRRHSQDAIIRALPQALETGVSVIQVVSGARPEDPDKRSEALAVLEESLVKICDAATELNPDLDILIEPLDYKADKRQTLGTTDEAVAICKSLAASGRRLGLCIDAAHLLLNGEDVVAAVEAAREFIREFHFVNAVTDPAHPLHGDRHIPFGPPGKVDIPQISEWMKGLLEARFLAESKPLRIYCEVATPEGGDSLKTVAHCETALLEGWKQAASAVAV